VLQRLLREPDAFGANPPDFPFVPVVGTCALPVPPLEAIRNGATRGVRLLTGTTRDEWGVVSGLPPALGGTDDPRRVNEDSLRRLATSVFGRQDAEAGLIAYRAARPGSSLTALTVALESEQRFHGPARELVQAHQAAGGHGYLYRFDWSSPAFDGLAGAAHTFELPFVFDNLETELAHRLVGTAPPRSLATAMHGAWGAFVRTGSPQLPAGPRWDRYEPTSRPMMSFDEQCRQIQHDDPLGHRS
jgi:para-nitrobenzyl esterase